MFAWNQKYVLSCPKIDDEHRMLFRLAENLHLALAAGRGAEVLKGLFADLIGYTRTHFAHEEALMRASGYPAYRQHKAEHEDLAARAAALQKQGETGKLTVTLDTMRFLREWLDHHINQSDRLVADHVRARTPALARG